MTGFTVHFLVRSPTFPQCNSYLPVCDFSLVEVFQGIAGDLLDIYQSSVSRVVGKISKAIVANHQEFINFPTPNEVPTAKYKFFLKFWWASLGNWNNRLYPHKNILPGWTKF